jgi:hypothetical protein
MRRAALLTRWRTAASTRWGSRPLTPLASDFGRLLTGTGSFGFTGSSQSRSRKVGIQEAIGHHADHGEMNNGGSHVTLEVARRPELWLIQASVCSKIQRLGRTTRRYYGPSR